MIQGEDEVAKAQEEEFALVYSPGGCLCFSLYRSIVLFSRVTESAANVDCLPALHAAPRFHALTLAVFLAQPESHRSLTPV